MRDFAPFAASTQRGFEVRTRRATGRDTRSTALRSRLSIDKAAIDYR